MVEHLLKQYGYFATGVGTFLEGETILLIAGFLAHQGHMKLGWVIMAAAIGAFSADLVSYFIGVRKVDFFLNKFAVFKRSYPRLQNFIHRYGVVSIFLARWLYGFRITCGMVFGMTGVKLGKFILLSLSACCLWALVVGGLGYLFGQSLEILIGNVRRYEKLLCVVVLSIAFVYWLMKYLARRKGTNLCGGRKD